MSGDTDDGDNNNGAFISVYQQEVESWRKLLKVGNSNKVLVAFAWCHDDKLQNARKLPECWACDTTFGVTKEQCNLFLVAGIDGNDNFFAIFRCFMPSKEARAYNWALRIAFKNLVGELALSFNQCIASDTEESMYGPICGIIYNVSCITKSHHRLDKVHLLDKEWKDDGDFPKNIIGILLLMLGDMFNYVETKEEMTCGLNHFHTYYKKAKSTLKSYYVTQAIEKIVISVKNKIEYVAHYNFMSVSTFGFGRQYC